MLDLAALVLAVGQAGTELGAGAGGGISLGPVVLRLFGSLAIIFGLIFVMVLLFRRYGRGLTPQFGLGGHVKVFGSFPIESKKRIYLVRVFDRVLLLGVGPMGLTALAEFDGEEVEGYLGAVNGPGPKPIQDFRQLVKKIGTNFQNLKGVQTP